MDVGEIVSDLEERGEGGVWGGGRLLVGYVRGCCFYRVFFNFL